jgi:hypothetical protein
MVGNHSTGEASKHKLVSVVEASATVMKESQSRDQVLENRRQAISQQIKSIHQRKLQVDSMRSQLEAELERIYRKALSDLKHRIDQKMTVLKSDEIELKRQDLEMTTLEKFLEYQQSGSNIYHLLFNWGKHQQLRQDLHEFRFFRDVIDVQLDLKIQGDLSLTVDPSLANMSAQPKKTAYAPVSMASSRVETLPRKSLASRRTTDFFAETLNALDEMTIERSSLINAINDDERSIMTTGYDFDC